MVSGSPSSSPRARTAAVLDALASALTELGMTSDCIDVRELPPADLLGGRAPEPATRDALARIAQARAIVVGTPVYKATFTGLVKTFLDLLPGDALAGKVALPIALGAAPTHALAVEQTLAPLLLALGADAVLRGLYITDGQLAEGRLDAAATAAVQGAAARLLRFAGKP
jgi:FMN reductase